MKTNISTKTLNNFHTNCKALALVIISLLYSSIATAQCDTSAINQVTKKFEAKYAALEKKTDSIDINKPQTNPLLVTLNIEDIDFRMVAKEFSLDLISVTMKDKKIIFNTPQVTMKNKNISFDKPETRMVSKVIGRKPNFRCRGLKCKVYWTDIITNIPEIVMGRHVITTQIPQFTYTSTSFVTAIPEIKKHRNVVKMNLPQITVKKVSTAAKIIKDKADKLSTEADSLSIQQDQELALAVNAAFVCTRDSLVKEQQTAFKQFDKSLNELNTAIKSVTDIGGDPSKLKDENNNEINLLAVRDGLTKSQQEANLVFEKALTELNDKIQKGVNSLHGMEQEVLVSND